MAIRFVTEAFDCQELATVMNAGRHRADLQTS